MSTQTIAGKPAAARSGVRAAPLIAILIIGALLPLIPFVVPVSPYVLNILMQAATYAIAVLGMTVVLGYTGHTEQARIEAGRQAGCDRVVANSAITGDLRALLERWLA